MLKSLKNIWSKIPYHLKYAFGLFAVSRIALLFVGCMSYVFLMRESHSIQKGFFLNVPHLKIWQVWDSFQYLGIAENGYAFAKPFDPHYYSNVGFFPLYPMLMRLVDLLTQNLPLAGIMLAIICLFVAAHYLYKLVLLHADEKTALRSILFLFVFPTSFILSSVYAESLFLCLSLMSIYYAKKGKWLWAGLFGAFLVLTKIFGLLILIPLGLIYLSDREFNIRKIKADILWLLLIPLSLGGLLLFYYKLTGDALAYFHIQSNAWGHIGGNPFIVLYKVIIGADIHQYINAIFVVFFLLVLCIVLLWKKELRIYTLYGICLLLFTPYTGTAIGSIRYMTFNFPLFIGLSTLTEKESFKDAAIIGFGIIQGCLMLFWTASFAFMA